MRKKIRLWILTCLVIWAVASVFYIAFIFVVQRYDIAYLIKVEFLGFGLSCLLLGVVGIAGLYFMDNLKKISLMGWRIFIISFTLFSVLVLPKLGSALVVADEGWSSLYKHPLVWLLIAFLVGNAILYIFKSKRDLNHR